jgi:hypothetical protein
MTGIDTEFEFHADSRPGVDPDKGPDAGGSPTLQRYHRTLWSKPLPSGIVFTLEPERGSYLVHRSAAGTFYLASDAITTHLSGRAWKVIEWIPPEQRPQSEPYTIGSSIVFPGDVRNRRMTINGARGFHPRIADRFDLTLECIRRHYLNQPSPLAEALERYADFFRLFVHFEGYVSFFLLQDLLDDSRERISFFHPFDDFTTPADPRTPESYLSYVEASDQFIRARNARIRRWSMEHLRRLL